MPKFNQRERDEINQRLYVTMKHLILEKDLTKITIDEITQRCNIAKGSFYSFYNNKYELLSEIILQEEHKIHLSLMKYSEEIENDVIVKLFNEGIRLLKENDILKNITPDVIMLLQKNLSDNYLIKTINNDLELLEILKSKKYYFTKDDSVVIEILQQLFILYLNNSNFEITNLIVRSVTKDITKPIL